MKLLPRRLVALTALLFFVNGCATSSDKPETQNATYSFIGDAMLLADVDVPPLPTFRAAANYPYALMRGRETGEVIVGFVLDTKGRPTQIKVIQTTNRSFWFSEAAINAMAQWKFQPALKNGKPVACIMTQPFSFTLQ